MKHYLFTKYDVGLYDDPNIDAGSWLALRDKIFNEITFPSVINQTNKDFEWVVFFDKNSKSKNLNSKLFTPFFTTEDNLYSDREKIINSGCMFTRLDNDDAILKNFMLDVRNAYDIAKPSGPMAVNAPRGYCYDYDSEEIFALNEEFSNPFITRNALGKTSRYGHGGVFHDMPVVQLIGCARNWVMVIHKNNLANKLEGIKANLKLKDIL